MFRRIRDFIRFGPVVRPKVKPARPPSARLKPPVRPEVKPAPRPAIEPARPETPTPQRPKIEIPPRFSVAVHIYIRSFGRHGEKPSRDKVRLAEYSLGPDRAAYLKALHMIDGALTRFMLPNDRIENADAETGLLRRLNDETYFDLDTWRKAERADLANRKALEYAGRDVPPPLHVPDTVQKALIAALTKAAAEVTKGGTTTSGGQKNKPTDGGDGGSGPAASAPEETGGRSRNPGKRKRDEQIEGAESPVVEPPEPPEETPDSDGDQTPRKP